uniref:Peptidase_M16_C domain-containing protein n=1 Tax=Soboliphyme baturini TaxID=241478 RepID=A0A183J0C5_9BILA
LCRPLAFQYLNEIVTKPSYEPWICEETSEQVEVEVELGQKDLELCVNDLVHAAAYRLSPMAHSLLCPRDMLGVHSSEMLQQFSHEHLIAKSNALVGVGVEHDLLMYLASEILSLAEGDPSKPVPAVYYGGERFQETNSSQTYFALAHHGVSLKEPKDAICQILLCRILSDKSRTVLKDGGQSRLMKAFGKYNFKPFEVSSLNYLYSDTGLFGVSGSCHASDSHDFILAVMNELELFGEKEPSKKELDLAKQKVIADLIMQSENMKQFSQNFATQVIERKHDVFTNDEITKLVESIQPSDMVQVRDLSV